MQLAGLLTLVSLGVFLSALVYHSAMAYFTRKRMFVLLIAFAVSCIVFSVLQYLTISFRSSMHWFIGVQMGYMLIVLLNPLLLLSLLDPGGFIRRLLSGMLVLNGLVFAVLIVCALRTPEYFRRIVSPDCPHYGPMQLLRGSVGLANWTLGFFIMALNFFRKRSLWGHRYLFFGYIVLTLGGALDLFFFGRSVEIGPTSPYFYPGLLSGLVLFQLFVILSLSHRFRDKEVESESSVHAMEESKKELMRMAYYDDMTGRPNRKSFMLHLNHHIIETLSLGKTKAVFIIDLDNFRDVNDTFGYGFGDLVIKDVGERIENRFGVRDRLYRLYGNQFAIIWDEVRDRGQALDLAQGILDDLTSLVEIDESNLYMGVSMGVVLLPDDGDEVSEVFRRCETALAEAKKDKNTYFFYSSELESRTRRKMSIVTSLREALKKDLFDVVYQPIVDVEGHLEEMEALVRCGHPDLKDVSPEVFIAVAESSGLIIPLTWWVLKRVAGDSRLLLKKFPSVRVNVNMSPKILKSRDLIDTILRLDEELGLSGSFIGFEITEGALIENVDQVLKNLRALRERGYRIALDDFGTGYSSLAYIKNLPLDTIKIDKRFIAGISRDSRDEALINSMMSIAENLKIDLVAEGVEMPNQLAYLSDRGCGFFQGFLFSKPVSVDDIVKTYHGS